jgi:hypothetical protein
VIAQFIAEVPAGANETISIASLLLLISGLAGIVTTFMQRNKIKSAGHAEGKAEAQKVHIDQPFRVHMEEQFVTRREFSELKAEIRSDVTEMKNLFEKTMTKIDTQNTSLSEAIEEGVKEGRLGRVALWNELNPQGKKLERVAAQQDVAEQIGKLADAITKTNGKNTTGR